MDTPASATIDRPPAKGRPFMSQRPRALPLSLSALLALDAAARMASKATVVLRDVLAPMLVTKAEERDQITQTIYARQRTYIPGGDLFEGGLFDWEKRALSDPTFAPGATVLLGGAGGGREIAGLSALGFRVLAFEPCEALAAEAEKVATRVGASFCRASYDDLIAYAERREGPLAALLVDERPSCAVFGWTSLTHLLDAEVAQRALRATATVTSRGGVLVSFLMPFEEAPRVRRLREGLQRLLGQEQSASLVFSPFAGFMRLLGREDVEALASAAGYRVRSFFDSPYPHAVLSADP